MNHQHPMISVPDAIRLVLRETGKRLPRFSDLSTIPIDQALHRVIARDIYMPEPGYPPFAASILDGYAIRRKDANNPDTDLKIVGRVHAGDTDPAVQNDPNVAVYVTTGAKIPDGGFDCVVGIENVFESPSGMLKLTDSPKRSWIRAPGSDISAGTLIIKAGEILSPVDLGLLLQAGYSTIPVRQEISVGILSSGNELVSATNQSWLAERNGMIPDVNGPMLKGLLGSFPSIQARYFGVVRDDSIPELVDTLGTAAKECDVLITTGGISMGDADLIEDVVVNHLGGTLHFGRLHMKPGKPSTFVTLPDDTLVFCLPGNPVSAYVCTHLLVQPSLDLLVRGSMFSDIDQIVDNALVTTEQKVTLKEDLLLDLERPEYHRMQLQTLLSTGVQQSSRLLSCQQCAGLAVLPQATNEKKMAVKGESYTMLMIHNSDRIRVSDSRHLRRTQDGKPSIIYVKLLQIGHYDESLDHVIRHDLNQTTEKNHKSGHFHLTGHQCLEFCNVSEFDLGEDYISPNKQDLTIIVGPSSLRAFSLLASRLRVACTKLADAMALRVMNKSGDSYVRQCVIGFKGRSCLIIYVSSLALTRGLPSVRDLLSHAIQTMKEP